jgi:hypothetical protein
MKGVYIEIAFWCSLVAGIVAGAVQTLTGYPGDLVSQDALLVAGIAGTSLSLVSAALLKRASG